MSGDPLTLGGMVGYVVAFATLVFTYVKDRRKTDVDESAVVFKAWKDLLDTHEKRIKEMTEDFDRYRKSATQEMDRLRDRVSTLEKEVRSLEGENRRLTDENSGLRRQIAQASRSTAYLLDRKTGTDDPVDEIIEKLDRAGHNLRGGASE